MMNSIQQPLGPVNFSEKELRKLALLLQQIPDGEGLASINQDEAELMKSYGGSGTPLPGTQGLGPSGGPVRSYDKEVDPGSAVGTGNTSTSNTGGGPQQQDTSNSTSGETNSGTNANTTVQVGHEDTGPSVDPSQTGIVEGETGDEFGGTITHPDGTVESAGDGGSTTATTATVTPPTYKDKNGNEYGSQADANAANVTIDANIATIEGLGLTLTTDTTFTSWMLANKDKYSVPPNSAAQMETAFNNAKLIATDAAGIELPKMVDSMNVFLRDNELGASASYDEWAATYPKPANLSETTMRTMYAKAVFKAERKEAFTLTTEELESWMRPPVVLATKGNFNEWWEGKKGQFKDGTFDDMDFALIAHQAAIVGDAKAVTISTADMDAATTTVGTIDPADDVTVGTAGDVSDTTVGAISEVTDDDIDTIMSGGIDEAEALLVARVEGTAVSPAEVQLKRSVENNLRMLLGATVGANADPARIRQLRNIWADMTQDVTGKAAELRSSESMAAEKELVALYQGKSTIKLQVRLANLEVDRATAFKNADLALAAKLSNQATRLTTLITQANIDRDLSLADLKSRTDKMIAQGTIDLATALANLQVKKDIAIAQGKVDLALSLGNLQKNILIAQTNVDIAVKQRALDDALAIIAYKGEMALLGLEVQIDTAEMQADLTEMGFELTRDLAEMDAETQRYVANLTAKYRAAQAKGQETASFVSLIATAITAYATIKGSDINMKTNISPGSGEVESFLDALNAYTYEYKDPDAPGSDAGMFAGVMAQDLEKTAMGASFVKDTPDGKMVDYGHGLAAILASQANIHDRIKHLEEG